MPKLLFSLWGRAWLATLLLCSGTPAAAERLLFDFDAAFDLSRVETRDASVRLVREGEQRSLRIQTGHSQRWPGITLPAPATPWDLSSCEDVRMQVRNVGSQTVRVMLRIDSPTSDGGRAFVQDGQEVPPGQVRTISTRLARRLPAALAPRLFGMRGFPGGLQAAEGIDAGCVDQLLVFVSEPQTDYAFEIGPLRAAGTAPSLRILDLPPEQWFPLIDVYGQYRHDDWPGKTHGPQDLARQRQQEEADLARHGGPADWNQYGGWRAGPQREATGFFRAEPYGGKWWLVDPAGRLFWSHGADCVNASNGVTPITDRKDWFAALPPPGDPLAEFYGSGSWAPHGYYSGKTYETYNFTAANLQRKYGASWRTLFRDLCHRRLRSWAMNTIANWSDADIYLQRKTPYVVSVHTNPRQIAGSSGYWGKFPDPFDPSFAESLRRRMAGERGKSAGDPWCLGYFVGNELSWGDELSLAKAALASPADQPAKRVFVAELQAKYETVSRLNAAWGTSHANWDALLAAEDPPEASGAAGDLAAFYTRVAEEYFRLCRDGVKAVAPQQLYLGCRFAWANDRAVDAAARYCDVVSYNQYVYSVEEFTLPNGLDKPVIIGEFHFGALDRGMFHTGLRRTGSQEERAAAYASYVRGALNNRLLVGTHWFQFGDQATTGRGDGENYQIGLLDICDHPYPETVAAVRQVGSTLYEDRCGRSGAREE